MPVCSGYLCNLVVIRETWSGEQSVPCLNCRYSLLSCDLGTRGFMNISNQGHNRTRLWLRPRLQTQNWSPVVFSRRVVHQVKMAVRHNGRRDSQSSELLEWKRPAD